MADRRAVPSGGPELSRRDFLSRGLAGRVAALTGTGVAAAGGQAAAAPRRVPAGDVSARDLRKASRDEVRATLGRIRARRRTR